ncbi:MAG: mechanosensitive ion channel family protein [Thermodesulfobacteriota bacterium]|nr:mechanosensitive ion channel family protein [Thermodesulfobacteriota bacterium]
MNDTTLSVIAPPAWFPGWLENIWHLLSVYPWLLALVIMVAGLGLAFLARTIIMFWGLKLTRHSGLASLEEPVRIGAGVVAVVVGYLMLVTALHTLPLSETAISFITRILLTLLTLHLIRDALKASHLALDVLGKVQDRFSLVEERTLPLFDLIFTVLIVAFGAYALLQIWDIDPTAWLASAGVVGIAVGFAARDTLANLFAGFFIIADAPYKQGDYVVLDSGERGEITKVGIRSTRMLTRDDVEITIPNSTMANAKIINESGGRWEKYRIRIKVGTAYGSDVHQVVDILEATAKAHARVCKNPAPRVRMRGFGDSSLDFELLCWIEQPVLRGLVSHELYMAVYDTLNRENIEIPFPQRDLWVRKMPAS